jgi:hypothetical protein
VSTSVPHSRHPLFNMLALFGIANLTLMGAMVGIQSNIAATVAHMDTDLHELHGVVKHMDTDLHELHDVVQHIDTDVHVLVSTSTA